MQIPIPGPHMLAQDKANHAKHLLLQFGPPRYIARGIVMGREQKPLELCSVQYAGTQFPTMAPGRASDFAVLRIVDDERDDKWQIGFYSFDGDIMQIEEGLQTCIRFRNPPPGRKLGD